MNNKIKYADDEKNVMAALSEAGEIRGFIKNYVPREERHYCALLYAWLISHSKNIKSFFMTHIGDMSWVKKIEDEDFDKCQVFYEYTAIRELIDLVDRKRKLKSLKNELKRSMNERIFGNKKGDVQKKKGDVQKKKPDLAFYFPVSKILVISEVKFEEGFDQIQFEQSTSYGEALREVFPEEINSVILTLLGLEYYCSKIKSKYPTVSWEVLSEKINNEKIRSEILKGIAYQKRIHPKAMARWRPA